MLSEIPGRTSVDHLFRAVQHNQMMLSALADQKANIILGVTFLMITVSATRLTQANIHPALLMLGISVIAAALFALAALMPRSSASRRDANSNAGRPVVNPLFFGGIATLDYAEYLARMAEVIRSDEGVYGAIVADIHSGAAALRRKYRWLRYSYFALLTGLALSSVDWLLTYFLFAPK